LLATASLVAGFILVDLLWRIYVTMTIDPHEPDGLLSYAFYYALGGKLGVYEDSILIPLAYSFAFFAAAHRYAFRSHQS
jgi:hypothetical protein